MLVPEDARPHELDPPDGPRFACAACWCEATTRRAWISSGRRLPPPRQAGAARIAWTAPRGRNARAQRSVHRRAIALLTKQHGRGRSVSIGRAISSAKSSAVALPGCPVRRAPLAYATGHENRIACRAEAVVTIRIKIAGWRVNRRRWRASKRLCVRPQLRFAPTTWRDSAGLILPTCPGTRPVGGSAVDRRRHRGHVGHRPRCGSRHNAVRG
jgi:hypothetical protein